MHDLEFEHVHVHVDDAVETRAIREAIWAADNVELTTVGIDIGSSTSHLMFAHVHLSRLATGLSSRFVVVERKILWQSPILLTPYVADFTIDTGKLAAFIAKCYADAGLERAKVDSGAVILTGEALKRKNARAIADLFAEEGGKFVCASAGHHMECQMAAHGSGAVKLSASRGKTVLNVDIGGGTTKFALIRNGEILATVAIAVGGRLIVEGADGLTRVEEPAVEIARGLGIDLALGQKLSARDRARLLARMIELIVAMMNRKPLNILDEQLLVTDPWPQHVAETKIDAVTFSGGVAEYLYGRETKILTTLDLISPINCGMRHHCIDAVVWDPGQGSRHGDRGCAVFRQTSSNTIMIPDRDAASCNLPDAGVSFDLSDDRRGRRRVADARGAGAIGRGRRRGRRCAGLRLERRSAARAPCGAGAGHLRCGAEDARRRTAAGAADRRRYRTKSRACHSF